MLDTPLQVVLLTPAAALMRRNLPKCRSPRWPSRTCRGARWPPGPPARVIRSSQPSRSPCRQGRCRIHRPADRATGQDDRVGADGRSNSLLARARERRRNGDREGRRKGESDRHSGLADGDGRYTRDADGFGRRRKHRVGEGRRLHGRRSRLVRLGDGVGDTNEARGSQYGQGSRGQGEALDVHGPIPFLLSPDSRGPANSAGKVQRFSRPAREAVCRRSARRASPGFRSSKGRPAPR